MKKIHWSQITSLAGVISVLTLALYSPHTQSSMSQVSREIASQKALLSDQIESVASPLKKDVWTSLEPAANATHNLLLKKQGE